jgi:hypothetical protein
MTSLGIFAGWQRSVNLTSSKTTIKLSRVQSRVKLIKRECFGVFSSDGLTTRQNVPF